MSSDCYRTLLAARGNFRVERCSCGAISLHAGPLTLRLESDALEQLAMTLGEAAVNNRADEEEKAECTMLRLVSSIAENDDTDESETPGGRNAQESDSFLH
tara:strand:- start:58 stop:360 length:303 start_codon:yes stop_codon:yes gene_type:complete